MGSLAKRLMPKNGKTEEKSEKGGEKSEKGGEKSEKDREKWVRDPLSGIFIGMILILLGAVYLGRAYMPDPDLWGAWLVAGFGMVLIIDAILHSLRPEWKRPVSGKVIAGIIFIALGIAFASGIEESWTSLLIAVGLIFILYSVFRIYRE